jgi:hypothetical protein
MPHTVQQWLYANINSAKTPAHLLTCERMLSVGLHYLECEKLLERGSLTEFENQVKGAIMFKREMLGC